MQEKGEAKNQKILVEVVYGSQNLVNCMEKIIELYVKRCKLGEDDV